MSAIAVSIANRALQLQAAPALTFDELPQWAKQQAQDRYALIAPAIERVRAGAPYKVAAEWLLRTGSEEVLGSIKTLERHIADYVKGGLMGLAPKHKGRQRQVYGWEAKAIEYRRLPSKVDYATIAMWLQTNDGFANATPSRVKRYLQSLPADAVDYSGARIGAHYRAQNLKPYVVRDNSVVPVGLIYTGDGHQLDWYTRHHNNGHHHRYELTPWIDVGSHYWVSWWLDEREHGVGTIYSLSRAIIDHDHVPGTVHVDPGPGFKNKMVSGRKNDSLAELTSFVGRLGMSSPIFALPGNAKGKGLIEGFFRWLEARVGKGITSYCGKHMPQELMRNLELRIKRGEVYIPHIDETKAAIAKYRDWYNTHPQRSLGDKCPAELWEQLQRNPLHLPPEVLVRPREVRRARRYGVEIFNRVYRHTELSAYEGRDVLVEYDLHNDAEVRLYQTDGRYIATAELVERKPWISESRIEDLKEQRLQGQRKRLQRKLDEVESRSRDAITVGDQVAALERMGALALPAAQTKQADGDSSPIDLTFTGY